MRRLAIVLSLAFALTFGGFGLAHPASHSAGAQWCDTCIDDQ